MFVQFAAAPLVATHDNALDETHHEFALGSSVPIGGPLIQSIFVLLMVAVLTWTWTAVWRLFKSALRICIRRAAEAFEVFPHNHAHIMISKSTQSMVTYTSLRDVQQPRFSCLASESHGVWDECGLRCPMF